MAVTSFSAVGNSGNRNPTLIEMALVSGVPKPKPEWENPVQTTCPSCQMACWTHDAVKRAIQETTTRAICTACFLVERDKQARL